MICIHHNDADGRCSAAIVKRFFNTRLFIEMDYKDILKLECIEPKESVFIVDFSFKPDVMKQILARTTDIVWIDHHKTAAAYGYMLQGKFDITKSGCELTWEYCTKTPAPLVVSLIGAYDTWRHDVAGDIEFYEGLRLLDHGPLEPIWDELFAGNVDAIIRDGETCIKYRDQMCASILKQFGHLVTLDGHTMLACNFRMGSLGFGQHDYDACVSYIYDGTKWTVSIYSSKIDVGAIALAHGGGGHTGAAGFTCLQLPWRSQ